MKQHITIDESKDFLEISKSWRTAIEELGFYVSTQVVTVSDFGIQVLCVGIDKTKISAQEAMKIELNSLMENYECYIEEDEYITKK